MSFLVIVGSLKTFLPASLTGKKADEVFEILSTPTIEFAFFISSTTKRESL
ncbi:hypothetical protein NG744_03115 [Aliarcobacter cryaerophilus]|uniref:hypothetical protein n=1 Tax=Aliarcobacter cryaerophilus TaxID=28198 RepID=UPI003DA52A59